MTEPVDHRRHRGNVAEGASTTLGPPAPVLEDLLIMASAERRYVEVFYDLADEYPTVYYNDVALATWLRLLMLASGVWPAPAVIPRSASDDALALLVDCGLIQILDGDLYRVRGLDKLRRARRERAQKAATERWNASTEASAQAMRTHSERIAQAMPHNSTQLNSTSTPPLSDIKRRDDERFALEHSPHPSFVNLALAAEQITGQANVLRNPFGGYARQLTDLVDIHGEEAVLSKMRLVGDSLGRLTIRDLVFNTEQTLSRKIDTATAAKEERASEIADETRRKVEATQRRLHFQHTDPAEHPTCPLCCDQIA